MSILSQAKNDLVAGMSPAAVWAKYAPQVVQYGAQIKAKMSPQAQAAIDASVASVKQGLSDSIGLADSLSHPLIDGAADTINAAFFGVASAYLGPFSGIVSAAEHDAVKRLADGLKAQIDAAALQYMAQRVTTAPAAPAKAS
jgi:hypothetical protein